MRRSARIDFDRNMFKCKAGPLYWQGNIALCTLLPFRDCWTLAVEIVFEHRVNLMPYTDAVARDMAEAVAATVSRSCGASGSVSVPWKRAGSCAASGSVSVPPKRKRE